MKKDIIVSKSFEPIDIKAGDYVIYNRLADGYSSKDDISLGEGVVIGFCINSGEPAVFFYSKQTTLIVSSSALIALRTL